MPTLRCPPAESAASMTGRAVRPTPVAENVAPSGSACTAATSACVVPGIPPGTPITRSQWTCPPYGRPYLSSSLARLARCPRSKISYSGTISRSCIRWCSSTMNSQRFMKTSVPKLTVPIVQDAMSGSASRTRSRCSSGSVTAPPEESWTMSSVSARSAATVSRSRPRSSVGLAASSRMCTWMMLAPTASQSFPVATSSSSVTGRAGTSALADSAPVGATVMMVLLMPCILSRSDNGRSVSAEEVRSVDRCAGGPYAQVGVVRHSPLDQGRCDRTELVMADRGADEADLALVERHRVAVRGQLVTDPVEVQQDQPARRPAEVVHPGHRLLPAVAPLLQVNRSADPLRLLDDRPVVGLGPQPRPAGGHPQRFVRLHPDQRRAGRLHHRIQPVARNQKVGVVGTRPRHPAGPAATGQRLTSYGSAGSAPSAASTWGV